ncbi:MAG: hypothetical protein U9Q07_08335, partial [Planctomycetota bacterium]|nr:hypothetical protein [Planctomycetota bacterium]
ASMTSVNNPSVRMFTGKVKINTIGRKTTLMSPSTTATTNAANSPLNWTPGRMNATTITASVSNIQRMMMFILV